jgi:PAS domain S-box-containing protein
MHGAHNDNADLAWLAGGGEMGARVRALDWSKTPVGGPQTWPQSLRTAVGICLSSRYPIVIWWGARDYTQFYNDAYISFLGTAKHPGYLGGSGRECWREIWPVIGPMLTGVFASSEPTWSEDLLLVLDRNLPREEGYFTFSYGPIRDDDGSVGGIFCTCYETTDRVVGERRLQTLRDLGAASTESRTAESACAYACRVLAGNSLDVPFATIYLMDQDGAHASRVAGTPIKDSGAAFPECHPLCLEVDRLDAPWPLKQVAESGRSHRIANLCATIGVFPADPWRDAVETAFILPLVAPTQRQPAGFLIAGVSPLRPLDADYLSFLDLVAGHIGTSIANARAYEAERRRAEALAEIDRAKTLFFSNISHEFRTPLTLMLGPLEDELREHPHAGERIRLIHRNALRLLKLVNTLLDFSRIEAGRARAVYQPTDLATFTADLASMFRAAVERAGLRLIVDCPPLPEPVFVDREMWEKIVLNLLSNAFKFTFEGHVQVRLRSIGRDVELVVSDTGTGIAADELPRLFERFHRVPGARGRTHEGSGIGLSLVQDLVRLHGGSVAVESVYGEGSKFKVVVPLGDSHLPSSQTSAERTLASTAIGAQPFVEEALRWLPDSASSRQEELIGDIAVPTPAAFAENERPYILLADDNADMRDYVGRLLTSRYEVETVTDGEAALASIARRVPDLVVADIMMPRLDGLALLAKLRADPCTRVLPVILVSARAGEDAKEEGLAAGADDYLVKPFSARELLAQIAANVKMTRVRHDAAQALHESERRYRTLVAASSDVVYCMSADWSEMRNLIGRDFIADTSRPSRNWLERYIHPDDQPAFTDAVDRAIETKSAFELEHRVIRTDGKSGWTHSRAIPLLDGQGTITEWIGTAVDITERKAAEAAVRRSEAWVTGQKEAFQAAVNGAPLAEALSILIRTAIGQTDGEARCAFYIADEDGTHLHHVVGMPESYARYVESFNIDSASLAYRLLVASGAAVITPDVRLETRWTPWLWLAQQYDYRGFWSFPVRTSQNRLIGTFAMYFRAPRAPTPQDLELATTLTHAASIIIARHQEAEERAHAVRALRESEARLQAAVNLVNLGRYSWNPQTNELQWDDTLKGMWGLPADAPVDYAMFLAAVHPDDVAKVEAAIQRSSDPHGDGVYDVEYRAIRRTDGVERWIATRGQMHFDNHTPVSFYGVALDITDRKRIEQTLASHVEVRTRELQEANAQLRLQIDQREKAEAEVQQLHRLEAIGQITSGIAHDFNNLLSVVLTNARLLLPKMHDADDQEGVQLIRDAAERGAKLTAQLLAFSRKQRLMPFAVNLNSIISAMSDLLSALLGGTIRLRTAMAEDLWLASVDRTQMESVILNLSINARDAMMSGGVLSLETFNATIDKVSSGPVEPAPGQYVGLAVNDTGVGIPDDVVPRVFEPFFTTKASGKGSGLGLAQVLGFAKQSGGGVKLETSVGVGTSVKVFLPRAEGKSTREQEVRAEQRLSKATARILVVDDDRAVLRSTTRLLDALGYATVAAASGAEALRLLETGSQIDLVLADFAMPEMTGVELARVIRAKNTNLPVVIATGFLDREGISDIDEARILQKPFTNHELTRKIDSILQRTDSC